jgi:transposase
VSQTKRAYKFRFYPTEEQKVLLAQTFGCVRFVYNWGLHTRSTAYKERGEKLSYNDLAALLPALKKAYPCWQRSRVFLFSKPCAILIALS